MWVFTLSLPRKIMFVCFLPYFPSILATFLPFFFLSSLPSFLPFFSFLFSFQYKGFLCSCGCPRNSLYRPSLPQTKKSTSLCLLSARLKGVSHHAWPLCCYIESLLIRMSGSFPIYSKAMSNSRLSLYFWEFWQLGFRIVF